MTQVGMPNALSLRYKLPLLVGGLMALLTGAAVFGAWYEVRQATIRGAQERLAVVSDQFAQRLDAQVQAYLDGAERLATSSGVLAAVRSTAAPDTAALGEALLSRNAFAAELLRADGSVVWEGGPAVEAVRALEAQQLRDTPHGGPNRGVGRMAAIGDTLTFPVVAVVREGEERVGYLVRWIAIRPDSQTPEAVAALVGLGARVFIGSPGGAWTDQAVVTPPPPVPVDSLATMRIYERAGHGLQLAVGAEVTGAPWMIVTEFPLATILAPTNAFLRRAVVGAILIFLTSILLVIWATRRITTPLQHLTAATERMAAGERDARVSVRGGDELAVLGHAFNGMASRVEEEVRARSASEAQWRLLFAENPFPMWVVDLETLGFLAVNEAAVERYGWLPDEWATMTIRDIRPEEDLAAMQATLDQYVGGGMRAALVRHRDRGGSVFDVELNGRELNFRGRSARLVMGHDVTQRQALEGQLRQAQKLEAVGRLAGGVAHDFNNSLAVISACAELAIADLAAAGQTSDSVDEILRATNQAHALTRQLLAFSRQQVMRPVVLDPNEVVLSVERMISRIIGEDIRVVVRLGSMVTPVRIDPGGLEQVLLNLAVNARDALPQGGQVTIATGTTEVDQESMVLHGLEAPGTYVVLTVSDDGIGMPPEVRSRIFDPFFTTKEAGKGTGLGLATAYGIVSGAGGAISVYSEVGVGSTFRVYLPHAPGALGTSTGPVGASLATLPKGDETILLVEDDAAVRQITARVLSRLGYRVVEAESPDAALDIAAEASVLVDLVLSDVVMPGMSGPHLVERLKAARPGLVAILMSGYAGDAVQSRGVETSGLPFIEKPFAVATLATTIRATLDGV